MQGKYVRKQPYPKKYVARKPRVVSNAAIAKIARGVVLRQAETKSFYFAYNSTPNDNILNVVNCTGQITQGTSNFNRIGEKIYVNSIKIKGLISNFNSTTSTGKTFRLTVFKSAENLTASTVSNVTPTRLYKAGGATDVVTVMMTDEHKITTLWDKTWSIQPTLVNGLVVSNDFTPIEISVPINRNESYYNDGSPYLKNQTYYVGISAYEVNNPLLTPVSFQGYIEVNFKDM